MAKKYKVKPTKKQLMVMQEAWELMTGYFQGFHLAAANIEKQMEKETGIKGIEFIWCDNDIVGIGNSARTMALVHQTKLEG
jgi:hypothetical protein